MLLSSTKRTSACRLPVFAVLSVNWTLERALVLSADLSDPSAVSALHARLWALRRLALGCALAAGVRAIWRHVDPDAEVRREMRALAVEVRRQSSEMVDAIERFRAASLVSSAAQPPPAQHASRARAGQGASPPSAANAGSPAEELASRSPLVAVPFALAGVGASGAPRPRSAARRASAGRGRRDSGAQRQTGAREASPARARRSTGGTPARTMATRSSAVKAKRAAA